MGHRRHFHAQAVGLGLIGGVLGVVMAWPSAIFSR